MGSDPIDRDMESDSPRSIESDPNASVRVYVNGHGVDAPGTGSAVDAVRIWDAAVAEEITGGRRALTDSRGLPMEPTTPVFHGLIMRVVSNRAGRGEAGEAGA